MDETTEEIDEASTGAEGVEVGTMELVMDP